MGGASVSGCVLLALAWRVSGLPNLISRAAALGVSISIFQHSGSCWYVMPGVVRA